MTTTATKITTQSGTDVTWYEVSGTDFGTNWEFDGIEEVGVTLDGRILDCDGCPCTPGDNYEVAVRNALGL